MLNFRWCLGVKVSKLVSKLCQVTVLLAVLLFNSESESLTLGLLLVVFWIYILATRSSEQLLPLV